MAVSEPTSDTYTHGHHESVVKSHAERDATDSAAFLLPHLNSSMRLLDIGCGPATITCDLARHVSEVVGVEPVADVLETARANAASRGVTNATFKVGSVYELDFEDDSFDAAYAHQVLQHLSDPVAAIEEMVRVTKPGGVVALRDADYRSFAWHPQPPELDRWMDLYQTVCRTNDAEPDAGRYLLEWALEAGVDRSAITTTSSTWLKDSPEACAVWANTWKDRALHSSFASQAVEYGLTTTEELEEISTAWAEWGHHRAAWFMIPHGELLIRVP